MFIVPCSFGVSPARLLLMNIDHAANKMPFYYIVGL
jgi:hypothetical protein